MRIGRNIKNKFYNIYIYIIIFDLNILGHEHEPYY